MNSDLSPSELIAVLMALVLSCLLAWLLIVAMPPEVGVTPMAAYTEAGQSGFPVTWYYGTCGRKYVDIGPGGELGAELPSGVPGIAYRDVPCQVFVFQLPGDRYKYVSVLDGAIWNTETVDGPRSFGDVPANALIGWSWGECEGQPCQVFEFSTEYYSRYLRVLNGVPFDLQG